MSGVVVVWNNFPTLEDIRANQGNNVKMEEY